jgi:putative membrane protein
MFFEPGFLGTRAAFYMDIVTIYFAILPFLLGLSIRQAIIGNLVLHYRSQIAILGLTVVMVILFEVGVRIEGGFVEYVKMSPVSYDFLLLFLAVHIFIALMAVGGWVYLIIASYRTYLQGGKEAMGKHRKMGKWIFAALTLTSVMGCSIYLFLFLM